MLFFRQKCWITSIHLLVQKLLDHVQYFMNAESNMIHYDFTLQNIMLDNIWIWSKILNSIQNNFKMVKNILIYFLDGLGNNFNFEYRKYLFEKKLWTNKKEEGLQSRKYGGKMKKAKHKAFWIIKDLPLHW